MRTKNSTELIYVAVLISLLFMTIEAGVFVTSSVIPSSGRIVQGVRLTMLMSPSPSLVNQAITIEGNCLTDIGTPLAQLSVLIQYSTDLQAWSNFTVLTDSTGHYAKRWTPSLANRYYVEVRASNASANSVQWVANSIVSSTNDILEATIHGGIVFVKKGTYDLNPTLAYPYKQIRLVSNLSIVGDGIDRTIIRMFPTKQPARSNVRADMLIPLEDLNNFVIDNLTLVQNGTPDNLGSRIIALAEEKENGTHYCLSNVAIRNVKITNAYSAAMSISNGTNILLENSIVQNAWTGIIISNSQQVRICNNTILNCKGDGIYFPETVNNVTVQGNRIDTVEDTSIDFSSWAGLEPHKNIEIKYNDIVKGSHIRITNSIDVSVRDNRLRLTDVLVDAGQARSKNVIISNNSIETNSQAAIIIRGGQDCTVENNVINMMPPSLPMNQSGLIIGIWGTGRIYNNTINDSANYSISFGGYGLGSSSNLSIVGNRLINFGNMGIWDDGKKQGGIVLVSNNTIWDQRTPFLSKYGIRTDYTSNKWLIMYNKVYAGYTSYISAPSSQLLGNTYNPIS